MFPRSFAITKFLQRPQARHSLLSARQSLPCVILRPQLCFFLKPIKSKATASRDRLLSLLWRLILSSILETRSRPCAAPRFRPVSWIGVSALQMRIVDLTEPRFLTTTSTTTTTTATTTTTTNTTTSTQLLLTSSCDYDDAHPLSFWILLLFVFLFLFLLLTLFFLFLPCSRSGC